MSRRSTTVLVRLADQVAWSAAFFLFNLQAVLAMDTGQFAATAVATGIGLVLVGVARAWGLQSRVVAGARIGLGPAATVSRQRSAAVGVVLGLLGGFGAGIAMGEPGRFHLLLAVLCGALTVSDLPRQALIYTERRWHSLASAAGYLLLASATLGAGMLWDLSATVVVLAWIGACVVNYLLGIAFLGSSGRAGKIDGASSFAWRMAAEAAVVGAAGQLAVMLLYWAGDDDATVGLRLSYAFVFAPAMMVVQGLAPLLTIRMAKARVRDPLAIRRLTQLWAAAVSALFVGCAVLALLADLLGLFPASWAGVFAFLAPVAVSMIGLQLVEVGYQAQRHLKDARALLRLRLVTVGVDIGAQIVGIELGGVVGLGIALATVGLGRILLAAWLLPRRSALLGLAAPAPTASEHRRTDSPAVDRTEEKTP